MPGTAGHACNSTTQKAKMEGLWIQGQPGLKGETVFQKQPLNSSNNKQKLKADSLEG